MTGLGEVRNSSGLGFIGTNKFVWAACIVCGKERWVRVYKGQPQHKRCHSCAMRGKMQGEKNPAWKGGHTIHSGYVFIHKPDHPHTNSLGYVKRARLILEQRLGRYLLPSMVPHHINRVRDDDRPENLLEMPIYNHSLLHGRTAWEVHNDKLADYREIKG